MSQAITEKSTYREAFEAAARGGEPEWLGRLRGEAFEKFEELGFPTTGQEDWKYTNVAPIARAPFEPFAPGGPSEVDAALVEQFEYAESGRLQLVFVNGVYRPELSKFDGLGGEVNVFELGEAARGGAAGEVVRNHLGRLAGAGAGAFAALNTALAPGGALVHLREGGAPDPTPIHLIFVADSARGTTASFPRVLVVAEPHTSASVIEHYVATEEGAVYFTNAVVEVFVGAGARVTHYKVQDESAAGFHVGTTRADVGRDAAYDLTTVTLGARLSRHDIEVRLGEEGAECRVDGLYLVGTGQHADTHSLIDHRRPHGTSRQNYKGILDGKSRAVFNGRVFVHRDAQQTDAVQSNKNLLLSPDARVDTKPQLEIYADDVKCAHGATVGQLEEEELFYLLSRGLHPDLARNLLTYGFAEEIVEKIRFDSIRAQLDEAILNRLHARLEA